jgi:GT2 family glycosyltransferase
MKKPQKMPKNTELSIIILNYNTKEFLKECLESLEKRRNEADFEIIVSDNGSVDKSVEMLKDKFPKIKLLRGENVGFSKGNNRARSEVKGKYILFLNPDTVVKKGAIKKTLDYLKEHKKVGAITCKLVLPNGSLDKDVRRSFPTPWVSFSHLVLRADRIFPKSKLFSKYWYGYIDEDEVHEVDAIQGAFFLSPKKVLDEVDWFDEDYFFDGEDIDLCYQIRQKGYKIVYYPKAEVVHYKGPTKGKVKKYRKKVSLEQRLKARMAGMESMERFYRKNLWEKYPLLFNLFVVTGIRIFKFIRKIGVLLVYYTQS